MSEQTHTGATGKDQDLARATVTAEGPMTTNVGQPIGDDQNSLQRREARPDPARRLPAAREDPALRPRAHPRAHRPRPRRGGPRRLPGLRRLAQGPDRRQGADRPVAGNARLHALLHRRRLTRVGGHRPRRARVRRQDVHARRQLGPGRQQHPRLLHPGRHQVPRPDPRRQARAGQRDPAGRVGPRHVLRLHLADPRGHAHADVGDERPGHPALVRPDGRLRRPHVPPGQRRGQLDVRQVPLEARPRRALAGLGRGAEDRRQGPGLPPPRDVGRHQRGQLLRVGARHPDAGPGGRDEVRLRHPRRHQDLAGRPPARPQGRQDDPEPQPGQLLRRDRAGGVQHHQHRPRHRLQRRPAAPGPQLLVPGHPAQPSGQPELHRTADQPARHAAQQQRARGAHAPHDQQGPRRLRPRHARRPLARRGHQPARLPELPRTGQRPQSPRPQRELRRPLRAGPAVLEQHDAAREGTHRQGLAVRAEQGRDA